MTTPELVDLPFDQLSDEEQLEAMEQEWARLNTEKRPTRGCPHCPGSYVVGRYREHEHQN